MHVVGEERIQVDGRLAQPHLVEYETSILEVPLVADSHIMTNPNMFSNDLILRK